jgi:hypothetical protein
MFWKQQTEETVVNVIHTLDDKSQEGYYTNSVFRGDEKLADSLRGSADSKYVIEVVTAQACRISKDGGNCLSAV